MRTLTPTLTPMPPPTRDRRRIARGIAPGVSLPEGVPLRQWVCSLPWRLRDSVAQAYTGAVLFIQRFDAALRLNVHGHLLSLDGVYVRAPDGALVFHELPAPSAADVAEVARRTAARLVRVLKKHGRQLAPELGQVDVSADAADAASEQDAALSTCYAAAAAGTDLFGERAGSPALRLVDPSLARPHEPVAIVQGVNVHAAVRVHGNDRAQKERLCRYLGRPPIAEERLTRTNDGRLRYELKRAWKDGTRAVLLSPLDVCARICALIPRPGLHMVRYHGVLLALAFGDQGAALGFDAEGAEQSSARRRPWAWLLRHVWQVDVSTCCRCAGPMKWVELATEPDAIRRVLAGLGLQEPRGARAHQKAGARAHQKAPRSWHPPPPEQLGFGFG